MLIDDLNIGCSTRRSETKASYPRQSQRRAVAAFKLSCDLYMAARLEVRSPQHFPIPMTDRAIQYSRDGYDLLRIRGVLDHPLSRVTTAYV
jgi:hypothetical protein